MTLGANHIPRGLSHLLSAVLLFAIFASVTPLHLIYHQEGFAITFDIENNTEEESEKDGKEQETLEGEILKTLPKDNPHLSDLLAMAIAWRQAGIHRYSPPTLEALEIPPETKA